MNYYILKNGDILSIEGTEFEVLNTATESDIVHPTGTVREFLAVYIYEKKSDSLHATNCLYVYDDKLFLVDVQQVKPLEGIEPRNRGNLTSHTNKREISRDDVTLL